MHNLFDYAKNYVIIYSSNIDKYWGAHEKDRKFTGWVVQNKPEWKLIKKIDNKYKFDLKDPDNTSKSDFFIYEKTT